ncbi:MAG: NAD-dependent succinate-semialdehyde dehydrogenase, partial [Bowdeniella nasicola]|nr:NAD-dependent succinate-semialdehyde dehydrogenase [Bowdeniella nasicola]
MDLNALISSIPLGPIIDGQVVKTSKTFPVLNPATGLPLADVGDTDANLALQALDVAVSTGRLRGPWYYTTSRQRSDMLLRTWQLLGEREDELAALITAEMGKPLEESRGEVRYAASYFRWFSEEAVRYSGRIHPAATGRNTMATWRRPVGPVLAITPWNFPLAMGARKIAPAIAAGCTVVVKPAQATPLTTLALMDIMREAGVPDGVVNCIPSSDAAGVCDPLLADSRLRKLTFTGSTAVGRTLLRKAADNVLRTSMELGGNAPFLLLPSGCLYTAVKAALTAKMRNGGQACTAANRFIIPRSQVDQFVDELIYDLRDYHVGDGADPQTKLGPLINREAVEKIEGLIDDALERGAILAYRGEVGDLPDTGTYLPPVVLTNVPADAKIMHTEIFGPVFPIISYRSVQDALEFANDTNYGLIAYAIADDVGDLFMISEELEAGMIAVNTGKISDATAPFGGIKHSGLGREGGPEGIEEYL